MSDAIGARVRTALDRLEAAEQELSRAARAVNDARDVLRTAFAAERDDSGVPYLNQSKSDFCAGCQGDCSCTAYGRTE